MSPPEPSPEPSPELRRAGVDDDDLRALAAQALAAVVGDDPPAGGDAHRARRVRAVVDAIAAVRDASPS